MHFLCVDQDINQAGKTEKCTMREKRRGMREVEGEGVPACTVEQKHLEAFTSALTQNAAKIQQLHHSKFNTFSAPTKDARTRGAKYLTTRAKTNKHRWTRAK